MFLFVCLFAAAASPTGVEDDLWSDFVQSGQSEVCILLLSILFSFSLLYTAQSLSFLQYWLLHWTT